MTSSKRQVQIPERFLLGNRYYLRKFNSKKVNKTRFFKVFK